MRMVFKPIQDKEPSQGSCIGRTWKRVRSVRKDRAPAGAFCFPAEKGIYDFSSLYRNPCFDRPSDFCNQKDKQVIT